MALEVLVRDWKRRKRDAPAVQAFYFPWNHCCSLGIYSTMEVIMMLKRIFLPIAIACLSAAPSWSRYGDTMIVLGRSPVPYGWVVVGFAEEHSSDSKILIKNLLGAKNGMLEQVLDGSPIPGNWVAIDVLKSTATGELSKYYKRDKLVIKFVEDESEGK